MSKLDDVKGVMIQNIDQIMQNHERLEVVLDKSENLQVTSRISFFKYNLLYIFFNYYFFFTSLIKILVN